MAFDEEMITNNVLGWFRWLVFVLLVGCTLLLLVNRVEISSEDIVLGLH